MNHPNGIVPAADLASVLQQVEDHLQALGQALIQRDPEAIERQASELQRVVVQIADPVWLAARSQPLPVAMQQRLFQTTRQIGMQRECLTRAMAALERSLNLFKTPDSQPMYSSAGLNQLTSLGRRGGVQA